MKNIAHTVVGQLLEDGASTRREILRRLEAINKRPNLSAVAAQLALSPVIPAYVMDDPNDPWWSSEAAGQLLAELKDVLHPNSQHGVKPGGPTRAFPGAMQSWQQTAGDMLQDRRGNVQTADFVQFFDEGAAAFRAKRSPESCPDFGTQTGSRKAWLAGYASARDGTDRKAALQAFINGLG